MTEKIEAFWEDATAEDVAGMIKTGELVSARFRDSGADDLLPIETEAPSPAKVRVDLALAAHSLRAAVLEFRRAEDAKDKAGKAMFGAFAEAGALDVVVKIDGEHYHFFASEMTARFRKIEVL